MANDKGHGQISKGRSKARTVRKMPGKAAQRELLLLAKIKNQISKHYKFIL
jgi:hypothetical protein